MRSFLEEIEKKTLVHDGSKGYMLQKIGLKGGECGEYWNIIKPEAVKSVYSSYLEAGADVIQTNTFPGNRIHLQKFGLSEKTYDINFCGVRLAKEIAGDERFVCASIGPTGILFEPSGELTFDEAYDTYCEQVKAVADAGADIINFETFTDIAEMRAALLAAKDTADLPVVCSMAFENNGRTLMGSSPREVTAILRSLGAEMAGANCSFGAGHMLDIAKAMYESGGGFFSFKPNAGLPRMSADNIVVYDETPDDFAKESTKFVAYGGRLIGGCCGTTPEFIKALKSRLAGLKPAAIKRSPAPAITSVVKTLEIKNLDWGKVGAFNTDKDLKLLEALNKNNMSFVEDAALDLAAEGYEAIYVNIDRAAADDGLLSRVLDRLQWYVREPLIINTSNPVALGKALRLYRGVAGVTGDTNSGIAEENIKSIVKKYGAVLVSKK